MHPGIDTPAEPQEPPTGLAAPLAGEAPRAHEIGDARVEVDHHALRLAAGVHAELACEVRVDAEVVGELEVLERGVGVDDAIDEIGRASCRERV